MVHHHGGERKEKEVCMACGGGGTVKEKGKEILSDLSRDPDPEEEDSVIMTRKQGIPKPRIIIPFGVVCFPFGG